MHDRWLIAVNPASGDGRGGREWESVLNGLRKARLDPVFRFSEHAGHIEQIVSEAVDEGFRKIASYGGDGSLNAAVNGLMTQKSCDPADVLLTHYPSGTGNDWCRMFKVPDDPAGWAAVINKDLQYRHDVGIIDLIREGRPARHYFINIGGVAYVATCARLIEYLRKSPSLLHGKLFYDYIALKGLFSFKSPELKLRCNGTERQLKLFNVAVAICRYNGGGMMTAPYADPADGLLDVTVFGDMPKWMVLKDYPKLRKGTIFTNPDITAFRTDRLEIEGAEGPEPVEADGESVGHTPAAFTIGRQALRFVVGAVPDKKEFPFQGGGCRSTGQFSVADGTDTDPSPAKP